jgi:glycosyltransferase involved in cell wall biosynthesis
MGIRNMDSAAPAGFERHPRVLLAISAEPAADLRAAIAAGREPRRDYFALQDALAADLLTPAAAAVTPMGRLLSRLGGRAAALAWAAFVRRHAYDAIYTDAENVGLPLALLLRYSRARAGRPRHVMLTHYLSPAKKRVFFRLGAGARIDALIVHSAAQGELARRTLDMPATRVLYLPYFADERFWRALPGGEAPSARPMICAVGLEFRDYGTLLAAVRDLPVDLRIGAASSWSHHSAFEGSPELPPNVHVHSYAYLPVRQLYAAARFVVVPLQDVDNQAGITVILEAMAMGKAVVVSGTRGQTDVVRDRLNGGRGPVERVWWPGFVDAPAVAETLGHLPTGFYVRPGDAADLRRAIQYLLDHPDVAAELGRNGRRVVEALFGLDAFTARFAAVIRGEQAPLVAPGEALPASSDAEVRAR